MVIRYITEPLFLCPLVISGESRLVSSSDTAGTVYGHWTRPLDCGVLTCIWFIDLFTLVKECVTH